MPQRNVIHVFLCLLAIACVHGLYAHDSSHSSRYFIANAGQYPEQVLFATEVNGGMLYVESDRLTFHFIDQGLIEALHHGKYEGDVDKVMLQHHAYEMLFENGDAADAQGLDTLDYFHNYFLGNNPKAWASEVPLVREVVLHDVYSGIDLRLYFDHEVLKYDFLIAPLAQAEDISILYKGLDQIKLKDGEIRIRHSLGETWEEAPIAFQSETPINCAYVLEQNRLSFELGEYDRNKILTIDPVLVFSTYSGSTANNFGYSATYDRLGYLYSGSSAFANGYPTTVGAYQTSFQGGTGGTPVGIPSLTGTDVVITKWDSNGTSPIWSSYLGGSSDELPHSLIVNQNDELFVMGTTSSLNFPVHPNGFDTTMSGGPAVNLLNGLGVYYPNGSDVFVAKMSANGTALIGGTYLGGTQSDGLNTATATKFNYADEIRGEIELDQYGFVYVATSTRSNNNPVGSATFQSTKPSSGTNQDGIIYKLSDDLSAHYWTAYLGSGGADAIYSIAIDSQNDIYVSGGTSSNSFPTDSLAFDTTYNGNVDGFVCHISSDGSTLLQSTFYGTANYDQSYFVDLDRSDYPYLFGQTSGPSNTLIYNALYNEPLGGQFIVKFTPSLDTIVWSTRFGKGDGNPDISPTAFLVDLCSAIYISGWGSSIQGGTLSTNGLDTAGVPFQGTTDNHDFYLMKMADDASALNYATFFGGSSREHVDGGTSRFDRKGKIYQAVCAGCPNGSNSQNDFPTFPNPGAHSNINAAANNPGCNLAVFKMDFNLPAVVADFMIPVSSCSSVSFSPDNLSLVQSQTNFLWDFGNGTTSTQFEPIISYNSPGTYIITLVVNDNNTCNLADTIQKQITILSNSSYALPDAIACSGQPVQIGMDNNNNPSVTYSWTPAANLSDTTIADPFATVSQNSTYTLYINDGTCTDTVTQNIILNSMGLQALADSAGCLDSLVNLTATSTVPSSFVWSSNPSFSDTLNNSPGSATGAGLLTGANTTFYVQATDTSGCIFEASVTVPAADVVNPLEALFTSPGDGCVPHAITFNNQTVQQNATSFIWDFGNGDTSMADNPTYTYQQPGFFTISLIAIDTGFCRLFDTITYQIEVDQDSIFNLDVLACYNQPLVIGVTPQANTNYAWTPSNGLSDPFISNPSTTVLEPSNYMLVATRLCQDTFYQSIRVDSVFAISDSSVLTCSDQPPVELSGSSNGTANSYAWSSLLDLSDTLNLNGDSTLTYSGVNGVDTLYFSVRTDSGCIAVDTTLVITSDNSIVTTADQYICRGDTLVLRAQNLFPQNLLNYSWTPTDKILSDPTKDSIIVSPLEATQYEVYTVNDSGCAHIDTILVDVSALDSVNVGIQSSTDTVLLGGSAQLTGLPQGFDYQWMPADYLNFTDIQSPITTPDSSIIYTLVVSDPNRDECFYSKRIQIIVVEVICGMPEIYVPNAFTPDGDGSNDLLYVRGKYIKDIHFEVFDRWGNLVFETEDQIVGWDGKIDGVAVDPGVFVWQLRVECVDGQLFEDNGNITVVY